MIKSYILLLQPGSADYLYELVEQLMDVVKMHAVLVRN